MRSIRLGRERALFDLDPGRPWKTRTPRIVYHYTSPDGFLGILESKKIRATAVEYLNDSKEIAFAVDAASSSYPRSVTRFSRGIPAASGYRSQRAETPCVERRFCCMFLHER